ncbi:MAG: hypothetical protein ACREJD_04925 [Phycisphaerales bacterium]
MRIQKSFLGFAGVLFAIGNASAAVLEYGDRDMCNTGVYETDPLFGAFSQGLAAGSISMATNIYSHGYPFSPSSDYAGTDQMHVGSVQTEILDGYANSVERINGPQVITMDYSSLVSGAGIQTVTLGFMVDDFQFKFLGQPFTARINGVVNTTLTDLLNSLDQSGPVCQYISLGLDVASIDPSHVLTLTIDEGGNGGDGWAIDFLTIGVTEVPAPGTAIVSVAGLFAMRRRRRGV